MPDQSTTSTGRCSPRVRLSGSNPFFPQVRFARAPTWRALVIAVFILCHCGGTGQSFAQGDPSGTEEASRPAEAGALSPKPSPAAAPGQVDPTDDWAADYLRDPLAEVDDPSLSQLRAALGDPQRRSRVLQDHFSRARSLTDADRRVLLDEASNSEAFEVRQQAAAELERSGWLVEVITTRLKRLAVDDDPSVRAAGLIGLSRVATESLPRDESYLAALILALTGDDFEARDAAAKQLVALGPSSVPVLMRALEDPETVRPAAELLGIIAGLDPLSGAPSLQPSWERQEYSETMLPGRERFAPPALGPIDGFAPTFPSGVVPPAMAPSAIAPVPAPPKLAPARAESVGPGAVSLVRTIDEQEPKLVRVYYGTNREVLEEAYRMGVLGIATHMLISLMAISFPVVMLYSGGSRAGEESAGGGGHSLRLAVLSVGLLVAAFFYSIPALSEELRGRYSARQGVVYGPRREAGGLKHYGYCDVSIPPTHQIGEVESPRFGPEDEGQHVILRLVESLQRDAYFAELRRVMSEVQEPNGCFVFVHGYNVDFDSAAKRTAQIHHDLQFPGVPIFYSWPSRGSFRHYFSDRNEVQFSRQLIKEFLLDVVEKSGAERVHVIAHSMGADAVAGAIAAIDSDREVFDQIILAAPDIDADVFLSQVAPRLSNLSKRTTLYCSRNDWALRSSYYFNDSWRAGDSSRGLLAAPGFDTIDASSIDTELLGHSYYGNCIDILNDVADLFLRNPEPVDRKLVSLPWKTDFPAWTFPRLLGQSGGDPPWPPR